MSLEPFGDAGPSTESENKIANADDVIVVEEPLISPPAKRLKQSRLPFSPLVQQQEVSTNGKVVAKRKQACRDSLKKFSNVEENEDDEVSSTQTEIETSQVDVEAKKSDDMEVEKMEIDEEQISEDVNKSTSDASTLDETICEVKDDDSDVKLDESGEIADKTNSSKNKRKKRLSNEEKMEFKRRKAEETEKRQAEKEEKRLERERLKEEAKLKREEAKLKKEEKRKEILAKKQEVEMKKEERRLILEEKKRKKEEEKQELLIKKMEEKQANEEKKKQQELEKSLIEEEKKQTAAKFVGFFKKHASTTSQRKPKLTTLFKSFEVKKNQRLAPISRCKLKEIQIENLDKSIFNQTTTELYLSELKSKKRIPCKSERTWPINDEDDLQIVNENEEVPTKTKFPRAKLLKFHENVRPPYWGTWRKKSRVILPRTPFRKDDCIFDYEVDSDDEWEEEEPGESLSATEDEMEKSDGEYEVDNEFFVPHGYLSDTEQQDEDNEALTPDGQKTKLRLQEMEFLAERKQKFSQIKPKLFGPIWCDDEKPGVEEILKLFKQFELVVLCSNLPMKINKLQLTTDLSGAQDGASTSGTTATTALRLKVVPEEVMPNFIRLVHGNYHRKALIIQEFIRFWEQRQDEKIKKEEDSATTTSRKKLISKTKIDRRLQDIATWDKSPNGGKRIWIVKNEILDKYSLSDLSLSNEWKYLTNIDEVTEEKTVTKPDDTSKTPKKSIPDAAKLKERSNLDKSVVKEPASTPKSKELTLDKFFKRRNSSVDLNNSKDDTLNVSKDDLSNS